MASAGSRSPTREARDIITKADDGDPGEDVYRGPIHSGQRAYHTDPECISGRKIPEDKRQEDTREGAQLRWYYPCRHCAIDPDRAREALLEAGIDLRGGQ